MTFEDAEGGEVGGGRRVPELLQKHMPGGIDFIPFRKAFDAAGKLVPRT